MCDVASHALLLSPTTGAHHVGAVLSLDDLAGLGVWNYLKQIFFVGMSVLK